MNKKKTDMPIFPLLAEFSHFLGVFPTSRTGFIKSCFCRIVKRRTFLVTKLTVLAPNALKYVVGLGFNLDSDGEAYNAHPQIP